MGQEQVFDMEELTIKQAAAYLKISERSMRELAEKGSIRGQKNVQEWRFQRPDLSKWLEDSPTNLQNGGAVARQVFEKLSERWSTLMRDIAFSEDRGLFSLLCGEMLPLLRHFVGLFQTDSGAVEQMVTDTLAAIWEKRDAWATPDGPGVPCVEWISAIAVERLFPEDGPLASLSDEQLMVMCKYAPQYESAFTILYKRYAEKAYRWCVGRGAWKAVGEEVVQEAFIEGLIAGGRVTYKDGAPFVPWFSKIVINRLIKTLSAEERQPIRKSDPYRSSRVQTEPDNSESDLLDRVPYDGPGPVEQAIENELKELLGQLPSLQRQIIEAVLNYGPGMQEIADSLKIPAGTVRSRLHAARKTLRTILLRKGYALVGGLHDE